MITGYKVTAFPVEPVRVITSDGAKQRVEFTEPLEIEHKDEHRLALFVGQYGRHGDSEYWPEVLIGEDKLQAIKALSWYFDPGLIAGGEKEPYKVIAKLIEEWGTLRFAVSRVEVETV